MRISDWSSDVCSSDLMKRYADYMGSKRTDRGLVDYGLGDWLDLAPPTTPRIGNQRPTLTTMGVTGTATYYQMLTCLVDIAGLLGRTADAADFARRADEVKAAVNAAFFTAAKEIVRASCRERVCQYV